MKIRLLPQNLINQIAAGEVIERPASVIKELLENAVDAGATEVEVNVIDAGKSFISVSDNGCGMDKESLELCVLSHATSKLVGENLWDIHTFGFRGEALPSIASISRLEITSAISSSSEAWSIRWEERQNFGLSPAVRSSGTTIEVRDLFFATPARLKFLKSDSSELESCCGALRNVALAFPEISFRFAHSGKEKVFYSKTDSLQKRVEDVLGISFGENTFPINVEMDGLRLHGFAGVPTFNKASGSCQYFFVNGRFVKDRIFASALKSAYSGLTPMGRYAAAVLYLEIPATEVDVNAHPSKIEVRFRESEKIRRFIVTELKKKLFSFGASVAATGTFDDYREKRTTASLHPVNFNKRNGEHGIFSNTIFTSGVLEKFSREENSPQKSPIQEEITRPEEAQKAEVPENSERIFLGTALGQIDNTYIVALSDQDLVVVDQHAAAERITLEKLKNNLSLDSQTLLLQEICALTEAQIELLEDNGDLLLKFGLHYEKLAQDLVTISAIPAILEGCDAKALVGDLIDELSTFSDSYSLEEKINRVLSTISCHGSLRGGKKLSIEEMNALLRQMERTPHIAQCCHGRPSYIRLSVKNLNNFFERS
ncbi:MAG: DNA mismatch repair endonuclease MutL [Holosporaceae bacterium]|jgi:DNA mismatch repair protein MutL|nr:DNA mismatch repair endonuclease MutL [Holosporaceae bacterium]